MPEANPVSRMFQAMAERKIRNYNEQNRNAVRGATVCAGSSLMENFPINEMLMTRGIHKVVYNRGMSAYTIDQYNEVLNTCVLDLEPSKLFINIGSNDLNLPGDTLGNMARKYKALLQRIRTALPECKITLLAFYPCLPPTPGAELQPGRVPRTMENVNRANELVRGIAKEMGLGYLDLNAPLLDENGFLRKELSTDDIHFSSAGYELVLDQLAEYL